jgi:serine/threonine-protein kinase HipA
MAHELAVWLFETHIGNLSLVAGRLGFCYTAQWLQAPHAQALSGSLPLQAEPFDDRQTRPFFAGLLPEGRMRRLLVRQFQVSGQNDFALLDHIGGECAGAVTFLAPGQPLRQHVGADVQWLAEAELAAILDELPRRPMLAGDDGLRLSLAGAQDKLPVVVVDGRIGLPRHGTPSSHILKPAIPGIEESVGNEGFCLALARAMQLQAARSRIGVAQGRSYLLVERYDRALDAQGHWQRLHQEDFCQALGVVPEMKYQNEGGPGLAQCFDLLRSITRPSAPQVLRLLDYVIFNALIGNHDAHGKNFSVLYSGKTPVLAPFYDVLSTAVYPDLTAKMAMKLGSKYKFSEVQARHWDQFAQAAGLSVGQTRRRIGELARKLPLVAHEVRMDGNGGFTGMALVEQIIQLIEQRAALTIRRLSTAVGDDDAIAAMTP